MTAMTLGSRPGPLGEELGGHGSLLRVVAVVVVVAQVGATAVVEMFLFLAALFVAVLWAWREGALRWV